MQDQEDKITIINVAKISSEKMINNGKNLPTRTRIILT